MGSAAAAASVTIIEQGRAITVGSTSRMARALDDAQYAAGDGPCLTAAREGVLVRIDDIAADERWPDFPSEPWMRACSARCRPLSI